MFRHFCNSAWASAKLSLANSTLITTASPGARCFPAMQCNQHWHKRLLHPTGNKWVEVLAPSWQSQPAHVVGNHCVPRLEYCSVCVDCWILVNSMAYHRGSLAHRSSKHGPLRCAPRVCQKKGQWIEAPYIGEFRPGSSQKHGTPWPVGPTKDINWWSRPRSCGWLPRCKLSIVVSGWFS